MTLATSEEATVSNNRDASPEKPQKIGVPKELYPNECRVAVTPDTAQ